MKYLLLLLSFSVQAEVLSIKPKAYYDSGSGKMISGKVIEIEDGKIKSVNAEVSKKTLFREDLFLLPGLFDCHTHVFLAQKVEDIDFEKAIIREKKLSKVARITRAKKYLKEYLDHGFTSLCDLGNSGPFLDVELRDQIKADANYPDFYVSGPGLATERGQFYPQTPIEVVKEEYSLIDDKTDIDGLLAKYKQKNVDILKIYMDNSPGKGSLSPALVSKILKSPLIKNFRKVTFHAIAPGSVDKLLDLKEVSIEHGDWSDWSKASKGKTIYFTMTDQSEEVLKKFNYYNNVFYAAQVARAKRAYKENVKLVFGTDFYFDSNSFLVDRGEFAMKSIDAWKAAGISNGDILKAMTVTAAESLKLDHVTGKIEKGYRANLVFVKDNPLENIDTLKNVQMIINKGQIYKLQKRP